LRSAEVQEVIGSAIGGSVASLVFEGDRRFQIIVRLSDALRTDLDALENLPVPLPQGGSGTGSMTVPLQRLATFHFGEGPNQISRENAKRRVVVTANVRGRDIGSTTQGLLRKLYPDSLKTRRNSLCFSVWRILLEA
jgi:heavy metal efflux system protein